MERYDKNLQDTLPEKMNKMGHKYITVCLVAVIIAVSFIAMIFINNEQSKILKSQQELIAKYRTELLHEELIITLEQEIGHYMLQPNSEVNDSILYEFLKSNNVWFPDILLAQAKLESGNYSSSIYRRNNNLYGMKECSKRQTTQTSIKNGYGVYNNWQLSVLDRIFWDVFTFKEQPTEDEYLEALKSYVQDSSYIAKIKSMIKK
jgi:hypothetical protein